MLEAIENALNATGLLFEHYAWSPAPNSDYGAWAEDGAHDLEADGGHAEQAMTGTVDYFTRDATGACKAVIETALENAGCAWYLNSVQYENDTGYVHWEWVWEVV